MQLDVQQCQNAIEVLDTSSQFSWLSQTGKKEFMGWYYFFQPHFELHQSRMKIYDHRMSMIPFYHQPGVQILKYNYT